MNTVYNFRKFEELVFCDFWFPDSGFRIPDSRNPVSDSGFRIPVSESGFRFPVPMRDRSMRSGTGLAQIGAGNQAN